MDSKFVILLVISALFVASIYSSSTLKVFANTVKNVGCSTTEGGAKVVCCGGEYDSKGNHVGYWCTTCDNTQPPTNCTDRYKGMVVVNPGKVLSNVLEGGVLEQPSTNQKLNNDVAPGSAEIIEEPKISKNQNNDMFQDKEELPAEGAGNIFSKSNITAPD